MTAQLVMLGVIVAGLAFLAVIGQREEIAAAKRRAIAALLADTARMRAMSEGFRRLGESLVEAFVPVMRDTAWKVAMVGEAFTRLDPIIAQVHYEELIRKGLVM